MADATDALVLELDATASSSPARRRRAVCSATARVSSSERRSSPSCTRTTCASRRARSATCARTAPYVQLEDRRITRRDELGLAAGVVAILHGVAATGRTAEQRIQDAVAVEPDPVELFSVVAEEIAHDLGVASVAVVRFETAGFGTVVGAVEPRGSATLVPGTTVTLSGRRRLPQPSSRPARPLPAPPRSASAPASGARSSPRAPMRRGWPSSRSPPSPRSRSPTPAPSWAHSRRATS